MLVTNEVRVAVTTPRSGVMFSICGVRSRVIVFGGMRKLTMFQSPELPETDIFIKIAASFYGLLSEAQQIRWNLSSVPGSKAERNILLLPVSLGMRQ